MTRFYKILVFLLSLLLLSWILPWGLKLMMPERVSAPFTLYSEVVHEFASLEPMGQKDIRYFDHSGRTYSETEFDSILPSFYYRQLMMDNRMPDSINGTAVDPEELRRAGFIFRSMPSEINKNSPALYPLLESLPKRVDLEMPDDMFRITKDGIQFIDMASNTILDRKSERFNSVMREKAVDFPIRYIAGNPTNRKDYDEGYFFVDSSDKLYHLKQMCGRPFVRRISTPPGMYIAQIFVTEYPSRSTFAFITDAEHNFYTLSRPDYRLRQVGLPPIDLAKQEITIIGNAYYWTVTYDSERGEEYSAIDAHTLEQVDSLLFERKATRVSELSKYLFPFTTAFIGFEHSYFQPKVTDLSIRAIPLGAILALIFCIAYRKKETSGDLIWKSICILIFGLLVFIPLLLLREK